MSFVVEIIIIAPPFSDSPGVCLRPAPSALSPRVRAHLDGRRERTNIKSFARIRDVGLFGQRDLLHVAGRGRARPGARRCSAASPAATCGAAARRIAPAATCRFLRYRVRRHRRRRAAASFETAEATWQTAIDTHMAWRQLVCRRLGAVRRLHRRRAAAAARRGRCSTAVRARKASPARSRPTARASRPMANRLDLRQPERPARRSCRRAGTS